MAEPSRRAQLTVATHSTGPTDCRELLAMLGLLPEPTAPKRRGRPSIDYGHGDYRTYRKGCRCNACREDHRRQSSEDREKRRQDPSAADRAGHGNASTYKNYGCRCQPCTSAHAAYLGAQRAKRRAKTALTAVGGGDRG
ncbi:hypothetical protein [Streptomyces sp. NPDC005549]|uniref:hypothetical protein n=1 Tax=Streptomyces sp. NPDC005549 TaxID=3154888 RepID=UPI0033ADFCB9